MDHKCFHHKKKWWLGDWMEVLANDIVIIILQYIRVSNQHTEYLKLTVSYVNYIYFLAFTEKLFLSTKDIYIHYRKHVKCK